MNDLSYFDTDLCHFQNLLCLVNIQAWQLAFRGLLPRFAEMQYAAIAHSQRSATATSRCVSVLKRINMHLLHLCKQSKHPFWSHKDHGVIDLVQQMFTVEETHTQTRAKHRIRGAQREKINIKFTEDYAWYVPCLLFTFLRTCFWPTWLNLQLILCLCFGRTEKKFTFRWLIFSTLRRAHQSCHGGQNQLCEWMEVLLHNCHSSCSSCWSPEPMWHGVISVQIRFHFLQYRFHALLGVHLCLSLNLLQRMSHCSSDVCCFLYVTLWDPSWRSYFWVGVCLMGGERFWLTRF